jgi:predicted PurR-regulated permease PerM
MPRASIVLLTGAAAVIVAGGIQATGWLVGPVFLALVVVIVVKPAEGRLHAWGLPSWAATTVLVLLAYGLFLVVTAVLVVSIARLATILPLYSEKANALVGQSADTLGRVGVGQVQLRGLASSFDYRRVVGYVASLLLGVAGLAGNLVFLLSLVLFLSIDATGAAARMAMIAEDRPAITAALERFVWGTRRFLAVTTVFGLLTGLVDTAVLWLFGVPLAVLWGLLVFITNYIPYVGFFIGLVPPAVLALLGSGWRQMLAIVALFIVINFVITSLVQPYFVGDAVGISITVTLVGLVFWGWMIGPLGAVLAIPLTLLAKVLLVDVDPRARWADALLGSIPKQRPAGVARERDDPAGDPGAAAPASPAHRPDAEEPLPEPVPRAWPDIDELLSHLTRLGELKAAGILTEQEFASQKARLLQP